MDVNRSSWWTYLLHRLRRLHWTNWSLTFLLRYGLVAVAAGAVVAVGAPLAFLTYRDRIEATESLQSIRAADTAKDVQLYLDDLKLQLQYLAAVRGLSDFGSETQKALLAGLTRSNHAYEAIAIVDRDGEISMAVAPFSRRPAADVLREWLPVPLLREAINESTLKIDRIQYDPSTQSPSLTIILPLHDRADRAVAALVARLNLSFLNFIVSQGLTDGQGDLYIVDRYGTIIARNRLPSEAYLPTLTQETLQDEALRQMVYRKSEQTFKRYRGLRGDWVFGSVSDLYSMGWTIVVEQPINGVYAPVRQSVAIVVLMLAGGLGLAIAIGVDASRHLVRPLQSLTSAAQDISQGKFQTRVTVDARNELGTLARAFNAMGNRLQQSFQTLAQKNSDLQGTLQQLEATQLQLVQQEKMSGLGQLVAGIAHEINNPINFIHGNLSHAEQYARDLLTAIALYQDHYQQRNLPLPAELQAQIDQLDLTFIREDFPKVMTSMMDGSSRVCGIVTSLRNFSRLDEAQRKTVDIHEGIENTLVLLRSRLKGSVDRAPIQIVRDYGAAELVECYPAQLNQVLMNVLDNAITALEPHRLTESVRAPTLQIMTQDIGVKEGSYGNRPTTSIEIRDNGTGMDAEVRDRIFDPFFTTKPVGQGTGLGLSIAYQIVTQTHGGRIVCRSILGEGTSVYIRIPR